MNRNSRAASPRASILSLLAATGLVLVACGDATTVKQTTKVTEAGVANGDETPDQPTAIDPSQLDMIDDMEDGDGNLLSQGGRAGSWFTFGDGTDGGVLEPGASGFVMSDNDPARSGSKKSARVSGSGFSTWGAGWGFDVNNGAPYDASSYAGIVFWAKSGSEDDTSNLKVQLPDQYSDPRGNQCDMSGGTSGDGCYDDYARGITLTTEWKQYQIPFSTLRQAGYGLSKPFDPTTVFGIKFAVTQNTTFDVSIDDIAFYTN